MAPTQAARRGPWICRPVRAEFLRKITRPVVAGAARKGARVIAGGRLFQPDEDAVSPGRGVVEHQAGAVRFEILDVERRAVVADVVLGDVGAELDGFALQA